MASNNLKRELMQSDKLQSSKNADEKGHQGHKGPRTTTWGDKESWQKV